MSSVSAAEIVPIATQYEYGREAQRTTPTAGSATEKGRTRNQELTDAVKKGEPTTSVTRRASTDRHIQPWLTGRDDVMKLNAGGERNVATGKIEFLDKAGLTDPDAIREAAESKVLYEGLKTQIDRYSHQLAYTQALMEIRSSSGARSGSDVLKGMRDRGIKISDQDYTDWKNETLTTIRETLPKDALPEGIADADIPKWIEDNIIDSTYRDTIMKNLQAQYDALKDLPQKETDPEYEAAKTAKENAKDQSDRSIKGIMDELGDGSIVLPNELQKTIEKFIEDGRSPDAILSYLRSNLLGSNGIGEASLNTFAELQEEQRAFEEAKARVRSFGGDSDPMAADAIKERDLAKAAFEKRSTSIKKDKVLGPQYKAFVRIISLTNPHRDGGIYAPFGEMVSDATKARTEFQKAEKTIATKEAGMTAKDREWRQNRLDAISASTTALEGLTEDAIEAVYTKQIIAIEHATKVKEELDVKTAKEAGDTRLAEELKILNRMQEAHGVRRDEKTRKIVVNYEELGKDIRFLSYHPEDGIQRLILSDLMESGKQFFQTGPDGKPLLDTSGKQIPIEWKTGDLSLMSKEDAEAFKKLVDKQGGDYSKRLLKDYYLAKGMGGLHGKDGQHNPIKNARHLSLKDHEMAAIADKFGPELETTANASEDMKSAVDEAKRKGVKGKGLLMLILGLLVGGVSGVKEKIAIK